LNIKEAAPLENLNVHLFHFCPKCGNKSLAAAGKTSFTCGTCNFKFYLNTAAAGIALIFNEKEELLVTRRRRNPAKGMLDFPGGFAEPGETMEACLMREVKEELSLDIVSLNYFCSVPNIYTYQRVTYHITDFAFLCRIRDFSPIKPCDDVEDFTFMDPDQLDKALFGLDSPKIIIDRLRTDKIRRVENPGCGPA
jgi:mutator protein MutT